MNWYRDNHSKLTGQLLRWHNDYVEPDTITAATITNLNNDGMITAADVTDAYNIL